MTKFVTIADNKSIRLFEFRCDVTTFFDDNSNQVQIVKPLFLCLPSAPPPCFGPSFFHYTMTKRPDDHHVGHISSPLFISPPKTTASFRPPLGPSSAAAAPSDQHQADGHHPSPSQPLAFGSTTSSRDGTAAVVDLTAAPPIQTSLLFLRSS